MKVNQGRMRDVFSRGQRGYTLIEMAISIIVVGVLAAPAMAAYSNYIKTQNRQNTLANIQTIVSAIQSYRTTNGTYPCPASLTVARTGAGYGQDLCSYGGPAVTATTPAANTCGAGAASGVCVETSQRAGLALPRVLVGAVPFRELQLDENTTYDGYGSRIVYAITQSETSITTINDQNGGISIQSALLPAPPGSTATLINPADSAIFVVFSPGPTAVGGWSRDGVVVSKCTGAVGLDVQNCNSGFEGGVASATPLFIYSFQNSVPGANFYDDQMSYFSSHSDPLWARVPNFINDIHDLSLTSVGVGTNSPTTNTVMDIVSSATTDALLVSGTAGNNGEIHATKICDETGMNCFSPIVIGGPLGGGSMTCTGTGSGQYMVGIDGGHASSPENTSLGGTAVTGIGGAVCDYVRVGCSGTNYVLQGFDATGAPICGPPPNPACPASTRTVCNTNDVSLAAAGDTSTQSFGPLNASAGGCRNVTYTCNAGTWKQTKNDGNLCSFTSSCTTSGPIPCGQGFSGNYTTTSCTNCSGAPTVTSTQNNPGVCTCVGGTFPATQACPAPFTGGYMSGTVTYAPVTCSPTYSWGSSTANCQCNIAANGAIQNTPSNCSPAAGYNSGGIITTQTFSTATCQWSTTGTTNNCACVSPNPATQVTTGSCPPNETGGLQNQTFVNNPGTFCGWQNSGGVYSCTCNAGGYPVNSYQPHDCNSAIPTPYAGGSNCYTPDQTQATGHMDEYQTTMNTTTCTSSGPAFDGNYGVCLPIYFSWHDQGTLGNQGSPAPGPFIGSSCSCNDHLTHGASATQTACYISATQPIQHFCTCY